MKKIELLAPAGDMDSLIAAVQAGADAIYLGGSKFSARAYASNFDEENMKKVVNYCHLYGVKVFVTVNTLLKEDEVLEALEYVKFLYNIGVDALIIQDLGLVSLINKYVPKMELHASTQMTVHNLEGAEFLKNHNFKRIVLSRELSLKEITHISNNLGADIEIFVHGALCICYSGQCLMSSLIGGRSGNRGRCAQPCRLPYTLEEEGSEKTKQGYLLSPKDICTLNDIKDIVNSGVTSLKIEGRMKRPEYVAGVISIYRRAIDSIYNNEEFKFEEKYNKLLQLFNREGFSKAYLYGNVGKDMMSFSFPKNTGVFLGRVSNNKSIKLEQNIAIKDGVRIGDKGFIINKIIVKGKEVEKAYKGDIVTLLPQNYNIGDDIYKTLDNELMASYEEYYKNHYRRKISVDISIDFQVEKSITLYANINNKEIIIKGEEVQKAIKRPLAEEKIIENLSKTGDTPFQFKNIKFNIFEEGFLPVSSINEVRRKLTDTLEENIINSYNENKRLNETNFEASNDEYIKSEAPERMFYISTLEQLKALKELGEKDIIFNPFIRNSKLNIESLLQENINIYLKAPNIIKEEFNYVEKYINNNLKNIKGIVTSNLGIIHKFNSIVSIIGDYKLNIFNSYSLNFFNKVINGSLISVELNKKEMASLSKKISTGIQMLVYGRIEVMVSEYCPIGSTYGGKCNSKQCNNYCERGNFKLIDRLGNKFPVYTDKFCRSYILNSVPLNLIPNIKELEKLNINSMRIDFTDESYDETVKIVKALRHKEWNEGFENYTRGHFKRGVE
ncbi:DUF3656 domain-containing U32 family peptidase [Clostridium peptidivorans]|uniref:DUF3656 domain-containing U32 family peptidase n=1 Tax=Clostridium peptidivorans TaxID=100174 RepID=UPI000BE3E2E6|nr:U32 family peptidase [Clostridium peptidivorans]